MQDVTIDCEVLDIEEAKTLSKFLAQQVGVESVVEHVLLEESFPSTDTPIVALIVKYGPQISGALAMKALDIVTDLVKGYLKKNKVEAEVRPLYGPDGAVVVQISKAKHR